MAQQNAASRARGRRPAKPKAKAAPPESAAPSENTEQVSTRVTRELKARLADRLREECMTEAGYVRRLLQRDLAPRRTSDPETTR